MKYLILLLLISNVSFAEISCRDLFEAKTRSEVTEADIDIAIIELHSLKSIYLNSKDSFSSISKKLYQDKYNELLQYTTAEIIKEKMRAISLAPKIESESVDNNTSTPRTTKTINHHLEAVTFAESFYSNNIKNHSVLGYAVILNKVEIIKPLLELGYGFEREWNENENSALQLALIHKRDRIAKILLNSKDVAFNRQNSGGQTALHIAVLRGSEDMVKSLIRKRVSLQTDTMDRTPLHLAVETKQTRITNLLLQAYRSQDYVHYRDYYGNTPLQLSTNMKNTELLLQHKARVDTKDRDDKTLLHTAAEKGSVELVQFYIQKGIEIDAKDSSGNTALTLATRESHYAVAKILLDNKADPNIVSKERNYTPLIYASKYSTKIVKLLIEHKADINFQNLDGESALHRAAYARELNSVKYLLAAKADVNSRTRHGHTPLSGMLDRITLEKFEEREIVRLLIEAGTDLNAQTREEYTALDYALKNENTEAIQMLKKAKAKRGPSEAYKTTRDILKFAFDLITGKGQ